MKYDHLSTAEKFGRAQHALESIAEHELEPEDRERYMNLFMELESLSGKYQDH